MIFSQSLLNYEVMPPVACNRLLVSLIRTLLTGDNDDNALNEGWKSCVHILNMIASRKKRVMERGRGQTPITKQKEICKFGG